MDEIFVFDKGKGSLTAFPLRSMACASHIAVFFAELPKPSVGDDALGVPHKGACEALFMRIEIYNQCKSRQI